MKKRILFLDRDGTLVLEPADEQIDSFEKLSFYPFVFSVLGKIAASMDFELVMITNQDGLGTESYPEDTFWPIQNFIIEAFENEGVVFNEILIDKTFASENSNNRKPNTGLLQKYMDGDYDLENSYVVGDRLTDIALAKNLGCRGILINDHRQLGMDEITVNRQNLEAYIDLETTEWGKIYDFLESNSRKVTYKRNTNETKIDVTLNLNGSGRSEVDTGIAFFDHMLDQLARHGGLDLTMKVNGDLEVDEHHTIEDSAIALGEAFSQALGEKRGIERYGFVLPMDDCLAQAAIDFGGRSWLVWEAEFKREMIGKMPTEMFYHFFRSFAEGAKANLNIIAQGTNEHHKIEAIFKAVARAIKAAVKKDPDNNYLPTTKGII